MDTLPNDMIILIFETILLITDKRQFLKTCNRYNILTKESMIKYENNYCIKGFDKINKYCVQKFTLELSHDKYFDKIPEHYIFAENSILISASAYFGNILLLDKLKNISCYTHQLRTSVYDNAAKNGQLNVFDWAKENGYKDTCNSIFFAVKYGHLPLVQWLSRHCIWDNDICTNSAKRGHLHILQWAHKSNFRWDEITCATASLHNQLPCLKYARENGCKWDKNVYLHAKNNSHMELLNWAIENGCPI